MNSGCKPKISNIRHLIDTAILMAQELQELIGDAIEASGDEKAMQATQDLVEEWEAAYAACGFDEEDHFQEARAAAARMTGKAKADHSYLASAQENAIREFAAALNITPSQLMRDYSTATPPADRKSTLQGAAGINQLSQQTMRNLANCIQQMLQALTGSKLAFFINVFSDDPADLRGRYISNAERHKVVHEIERLLTHLKSSSNRHTLH